MRVAPAVRVTGLSIMLLVALGSSAPPLAAQGPRNTGTDPTGTNPLPAGSLDPNWSFVLGQTGNPGAGASAFVVAKHPEWATPPAPSMWISRAASGNTGVPVGPVTFFMQFVVAGLDPSTVALSGVYSTDDSMFGMFLNGADTGVPARGPRNHGALTPFTITDGFVSGVNTLAVQMDNSPIFGGPSGLLVAGLALTGQNVVPEPGSVVLLATGLVAIMCMGTVRRTRT